MIVLALSMPMLGACSSIFGKPFSFRSGHRAQPAVAAADQGAELIAQGRKALQDGQLGTAVTMFRNAKQVPEQEAAAANGLAIAYSQLGRPDLAERYFREAVAIAPAERRYQANLQHFYRLNPVDLAVTALPAQAGVAYGAAPVDGSAGTLGPRAAANAKQTVTVAQPASRLVRVSAREVRIGGGQATAMSAQSPVRVATPAVAGRPAVTATPISAAYPLRFSLQPSEVFVGGTTAPKRVQTGPQLAAAPQYPIRTEFKITR